MPIDTDDIERNAGLLLHRYEEETDSFQFLSVPRSIHSDCTFITEEHLPKGLEQISISRGQLPSIPKIPQAPLNYIFHSAYCCSTMLARGFELEGLAMSLKEPQILNDMIGWKRRGAQPRDVAAVTDHALAFLARPFAESEAIIIKPSNIVNPLAMVMLAMRPEAKALLLHAPLENYLNSIARKKMWGRLWVRELLVGRIKDQLVVGDMNVEELLGLSDLQIAALGWLSDHRLFEMLASKFGADRVRTLDSETFLADKKSVMQKLSDHFDIPLDNDRIENVLEGPAFTTNSKTGESFSADDRRKIQRDSAALHSEEIEMVAKWAKELAASYNISMKLQLSLV